ncbi:hypothetical protein Q7C36_019726 [Tachysurus vachellii]|uniref:Uncharacterized protein n=1 Tax=Tachysurus vachellii TaxID=175792 RepID=A0AA88RWY4_TACVA|nr:hypothetical protein Q7C36_019726 [Tachysurus vachellii]
MLLGEHLDAASGLVVLLSDRDQPVPRTSSKEIAFTLKLFSPETSIQLETPSRRRHPPGSCESCERRYSEPL